MSTTRICLGARGDGTFGLWVSKPGFDARTATDDQLLLGVNQLTEQLIMIGRTTSLPTTVPFGFVNAPFVLLTSTNLSFSVATGLTAGGSQSTFTSVSGLFARPYPRVGSSSQNTQAAVSAANMVITCPGGGVSVATYAVYRRKLS